MKPTATAAASEEETATSGETTSTSTTTTTTTTTTDGETTTAPDVPDVEEPVVIDTEAEATTGDAEVVIIDGPVETETM